jgi:hypothetical protein
MTPHTNAPTVFFIFLLETAQTALTAVDIYYWFMGGFGDLEGIFANTRFAPIDAPMIAVIVSLIIQLFFYYRISTLNKRLWSVSLVMAVVSLPPTFRELIHHSNPKAIFCSSVWGLTGRIQGDSNRTLVCDLASNACLRESTRRSSQLYMYTFLFRHPSPSGLPTTPPGGDSLSKVK